MKRTRCWMAAAMCGWGALAAGAAGAENDLPADELFRQAYRAVVDAELAGVINRRADGLIRYK